MSTTNNSLVKYDTPVLVSEAAKKKAPKLSQSKSKPTDLKSSSKKTLPPVENKAQASTEDILYSIIPPR